MKLYEIGEGVNRIRVRAHDGETELYDLAPAEVVWVRDATPPQLDWLWTPEQVGRAGWWVKSAGVPTASCVCFFAVVFVVSVLLLFLPLLLLSLVLT